MGFLLALLGLVIAGDALELEPVRLDPGNTYGCDRWSAGKSHESKARCDESPYCRWGNPDGNGNKCFDDPCLKLLGTDDLCEQISVGSLPIACRTISSATLTPNVANADCGDNQTVLDLCVQPGKADALYTYCVYAQLRDQKCPASVCREYALDALDTKLDKHCTKNTPYAPPSTTASGCNLLSTSEECGLVPKCYWKSGGCLKDPCFIQEESIPIGEGGTTCATYKPGNDASIKCKEVKLFKKNGAGGVTTYCVHEDNSKPNLCYLGNPGISSNDDNDDNGFTYPTLVINPATGTSDDKPTCSTTAASCDNMGETCSVKLNQKGGLAGAYCGDEGHGAANILRIPSLLVVLLIALFSIFS